MSRESRATNIRVGVFVLFGLALAAFAIFAIGQKSGLFEGKSTLYAHFADINGLVEGAPVRLAGLDVGTVKSIHFPESPKQREAVVEMSISTKYMPRIRKDSRAAIDSKGLLGDKIINITMGSASSPAIADGGTLETKTAPSIEHLAGQVEEAITSVSQVARSADQAIRQLSNEQTRKDLQRITASIANILEQVERGNGLAHALLYDTGYNAELHAILQETRGSVASLHTTLGRIDRAVGEVEHGDSLAHALVFGQGGDQIIANLSDAAGELAALVRAVREGNGLAHALLYEPENARAITELSQAATRINAIVADIQKGRGTLGGLIVDPSVYEDLKTVLGNVKRNVLLKALIRWTIKKGDIERPADLPVEPVPDHN